MCDASNQLARLQELKEAQARVAELEKENRQLKEAVTSHADVDRAIGVLVAVGQLPPDRAWRVLREISQHTNTKLRYIALQLTHWGHTGNLPTTLRAELYQQLRHAPVGCTSRTMRLPQHF
ncbi:ANTAR domain-containing protein [Streptomyces sp. SGAir0957]